MTCHSNEYCLNACGRSSGTDAFGTYCGRLLSSRRNCNTCYPDFGEILAVLLLSPAVQVLLTQARFDLLCTLLARARTHTIMYTHTHVHTAHTPRRARRTCSESELLDTFPLSKLAALAYHSSYRTEDVLCRLDMAAAPTESAAC